MKNQTVSVIIPLYNKEKHVLRTLQSISEQTYPVTEILVVDDGSTDNSAELVRNANIPKVRLIQKENGGVSSARNLGIREAKGDFIAFLDADDQWMPMFIEQMLDLSIKYPVAGAFASRYQYALGEGKFRDAKIALQHIPLQEGLLDDFFQIASEGDLPFLICTLMLRKSVIENIGEFCIGEPMGEDQDFMCRIAERYKIAYSKNINLLYHLDATNRACNNHLPAQECPFSKRVMSRALNDDSLSRDRYQARIKFCAAHLCHLAKRNIQAGNMKIARELLKDQRTWTKPLHKIALSILCFWNIPLVR